MKAEINNENKAKFFALYYEERVLMSKHYESPIPNIGASIDYLSADDYISFYLQLKPLSLISDEDAEIIDLGSEDYNEDGWWDKHGDFYWWSYTDVDYLRSKGYAVPWMGLSVDEMVEAGWIKLIES